MEYPAPAEKTADRPDKSQTSAPAATTIGKISNATVLKAVTVLRFAQTIKRAGELYYECKDDSKKVYKMKNMLWQNSYAASETFFDDVVEYEIRELEKSIKARKQRALDMTVSVKKD